MIRIVVFCFALSPTQVYRLELGISGLPLTIVSRNGADLPYVKLVQERVGLVRPTITGISSTGHVSKRFQPLQPVHHMSKLVKSMWLLVVQRWLSGIGEG